MAKTFQFQCGKCATSLSVPADSAQLSVACPSCEAESSVNIFEALFRAIQPGGAGEAVLTETESNCFYHSDKKASAICDACGRFLCALCDIDFAGRHLCPTCLETGEKKEKLDTLKRECTRHDVIALTLAVVPMFLFMFPTMFTAPVTVYYVVRYWKEPRIVPYNRWRFLVALIIAVLQILFWVEVALSGMWA